MAYVLPQVLIYQRFRQISQDVVGNLNACIVGPNYQLARYNESAEKALTKLSIKYAGTTTEADYPNNVKNVDTGYVKVFFEDVVANYYEFPNVLLSGGSLYSWDLKPLTHYNPTVGTAILTVSGYASSSVVSGDKYYFIPGKIYDASSEQASNKVAVYRKSAITGDTEFLAAYDAPGNTTGSDANGPAFTCKASLSSAASQIVLPVYARDADSQTQALLFTIRVRDNVIPEFYKKIEAYPGNVNVMNMAKMTCDPSGTEFAVTDNEQGLVVTIPATVPSTITTAEALAALFAENTLFSKYFEVADATDEAGIANNNIVVGTGESKTVLSGGYAAYTSVVSLNDLTPVVKVGDAVSYSANSVPSTTAVSGFVYADAVPCVSAVRETTDPAVVPSRVRTSTPELVISGGNTYTGKKDTRYLFEVVETGATDGAVKFLVTNVDGYDLPVTLTGSDLQATNGAKFSTLLGSLYVKFASSYTVSAAKLPVGTAFVVDVFSAKKSIVSAVTPFDAIPAAYVASAALGRKLGSYEVPAEYEDGGTTYTNWTATSDGITFQPGIKIPVKDENGDDSFITVTSATPFVQYRALVKTYAGTVHDISTTNDIETHLGAISPDNPLAQGCYHALLNSGDQPVYFIATVSDDVSGYRRAFERLELATGFHAVVPTTLDDEVLVEAQKHVASMSGAEAKKWRIVIGGISSDDIVAIYNNAHHPLDKEYDATVIGDNVVFSKEDETVATDKLEAGDLFRYAFQPDGTYLQRTVQEVIDNQRLVLVPKSVDASENPDYFIGDVTVTDNVTVPAKCEVWRHLESAKWIEYVANKIASFADRRVYLIFPPVLWNNGVKYPGYFGAAAIAGLSSSVPPQQGLTNIELKGFDDIPMTYELFTRRQLNNIAEHGGLIIMQDVPEGPVYVRHQVSTAAKDGNLLTTELSVTKDVDAISYYFADILEPFIGKYNISPAFLEQLRTTITGGLNYLGSYNTGSGLLGPMLLADSEDTKIVGIRQHETLKDHAVVSLTLDIPLPCNVIEMYLSV